MIFQKELFTVKQEVALRNVSFCIPGSVFFDDPCLFWFIHSLTSIC